MNTRRTQSSRRRHTRAKNGELDDSTIMTFIAENVASISQETEDIARRTRWVDCDLKLIIQEQGDSQRELFRLFHDLKVQALQVLFAIAAVASMVAFLRL